jgi:hypothetical protein
MKAQPKALLLASSLEARYSGCHTDEADLVEMDAAAELRRLHKAHEDLLLILWWIGDRCPEFMLKKEPSRAHQEIVYDVGACARAAIKRATKDEQ